MRVVVLRLKQPACIVLSHLQHFCYKPAAQRNFTMHKKANRRAVPFLSSLDVVFKRPVNLVNGMACLSPPCTYVYKRKMACPFIQWWVIFISLIYISTTGVTTQSSRFVFICMTPPARFRSVQRCLREQFLTTCMCRLTRSSSWTQRRETDRKRTSRLQL